jgi:Sulfatase
MVNTVAAPFDRTVLPIPETEHPPITEIDARKATPPTRFEVKAPPRAPNVMVVLIDNLGFGATKPFGGAISMPTLERLAEDGLIYNNFRVAPACSPSRVALLTGRNSHSANMGALSEMDSAHEVGFSCVVFAEQHGERAAS